MLGDPDPVHEVRAEHLGMFGTEDISAPGWYFWLETWASRQGPYASELVAREALVQYVEKLLHKACAELLQIPIEEIGRWGDV